MSSPANLNTGGEEKKLEIEKVVESQVEVADTESKRIQPWKEQITVRGLVVSTVLGIIYSIIAMKLNLSAGIVPNFNVSAALLAFLFVRSWNKVLHKAGFISKPFTRQENTIIQTCVVSCYSIAVHEQIMIVDLKLTFPSGLATAVLINGFHTQGDKMAKKQVGGFLKYFSISFMWGFFKWFFSGTQDCGFAQFPTFGLQAWKQTFYFDFNMTYVGAGMICPHLVNLSLLLGAILSFGVIWPLIDRRKGDWFPTNLDESNMKALYGYKVFLTVALILGDGLYNFVKILVSSILSVHEKIKNRKNASSADQQRDNAEELKQKEVFLRDNISMWIGTGGYIVLSVISIIVIPLMFPQLKWFYVVVAYILAPSLAFCNAYGTGLTDMNMAYNYGKVALFVVAAMSGRDNGVVAGLVWSAMFICQLIGTALGCVIAPLSFFLFYKAFDVGNPHGEFKAPYALIYRNMAVLGVEGFSALPQHCLQLCYGFFAFAVVVNMVRDLSPNVFGKWMPLPMVMAIPFLVGAYFAIDMCLGSLVVYVWHKLNTKKAEAMIPATASGLICGEGLWALPASILALAKVNPPICMNFLAS
ncbi:Metal-nicotianamine transporter YSL1 [Glycine soja]|uniref:Metal-nicotianamine transporter YSL1 n=1 Tax=Glycine soja TaxID=3848 RepID=A0A0B2SN68_GLYSO|nr:Metal-nicotianamine transporter YSL1 [Glycine soja]